MRAIALARRLVARVARSYDNAARYSSLSST
jgi:hypothetical protein